MLPNKITALFNSRRFWLTLATMVGVLANDFLGMGVDEEAIKHIVLVVAAWVLGDSINKTV